MPHFSESGSDMVMCQCCHQMVDTALVVVHWRPDLTGSESAGNACEDCVQKEEMDEGPCMGCGTRCGTNGRCME